MRVARRKRLGPLISMTPMIDVLFILLVFFMVTSTFLDLDMIPLIGGARPGAQSSDQSSPNSSPAPPAPRGPATEIGSFLVRRHVKRSSAFPLSSGFPTTRSKLISSSPKAE